MEWAPQDLALSKICEQIVAIMMALRSDITNFEEDSKNICYVSPWIQQQKYKNRGSSYRQNYDKISFISTSYIEIDR